MVFAFTFMIVFILISFGLWFCTLGVVIEFLVKGLLEPILPRLAYTILVSFVVFFSFTTGLIYFFDFLTLGWLKRKKWASKFYYPIYRFYSFITLSSLYRPIYYNLINHKYGRNLSKLLIPYILIVLFFASISVEYHPHYPKEHTDKNLLNSLNYDDERADLSSYIDKISLPSKYVSNGFLEVFIHYNSKRYTYAVEKICPDLKPLREVGYKVNLFLAGTHMTTMIYRLILRYFAYKPCIKSLLPTVCLQI
ncbi:MAG: hypothetical protein ACJAYJ_000772 [Saprospiraceae bacterium]